MKSFLFSFLAAILTALLIASPVLAYVYPLDSGAIRDAYLLGSERGSAATDFFAAYKRDIPEIQLYGYVSSVRITTPYAQIAEAGQDDQNKDAQSAVAKFLNAKMKFRIDALIFYLQPESGSPDVRISVLQNGKEIRMEEEKKREKQVSLDSPPMDMSSAPARAKRYSWRAMPRKFPRIVSRS